MPTRLNNGPIVVLHHRHGPVTDVQSFESEKELVQNYISQKAIGSPYWGSKEHVDALKETRQLLDRIITEAEQHATPPRTFPLAPSMQPPPESTVVPGWVERFIAEEDKEAAVAWPEDSDAFYAVKRLLKDLREAARGR